MTDVSYFQKKHKLLIIYSYLMSLLVFICLLAITFFYDFSYEVGIKNLLYTFSFIAILLLYGFYILLLLINLVYGRFRNNKLGIEVGYNEEIIQQESFEADHYGRLERADVQIGIDNREEEIKIKVAFFKISSILFNVSTISCLSFLFFVNSFGNSFENSVFFEDILLILLALYLLLILFTPILLIDIFKSKNRDSTKSKLKLILESKDYEFEGFEPKGKWIEIEYEYIDEILKKLILEDKTQLESWFKSPLTLENIIEKNNMNFIRKKMRKKVKRRNTLNKVYMILLKKMFYNWTEEEYKINTVYLVERYINRYGDWWEKPILRRWFESKKDLVEIFGIESAGQIICSIIIQSYQINYIHYLTSKKTPVDARYITYSNIINKIREKMAGFEDLEKWRVKKRIKLFPFNQKCAYICVIFLIISFISVEFFYYNDIIWWIIGYIGLFLIILFVIFLIRNSKHIIQEIDNFWARIFILTLDITFFFYFSVGFIILSILILLIFYLCISFCWIILIISFSIFKTRTRFIFKTYENNKSYYYSTFIGFLILASIFLFLSILILTTPPPYQEFLLKEIEQLDFAFFFMILFLFLFKVNSHEWESIFSPDFWSRKKRIKPLEVYRKIGILNDFALILANLSNISIEEVIEKLDLSKSIEENYKKFGIKFKTNIDSMFRLITRHKDLIINTIIPKCPEDTTCVVLDNKLDKFEQDIFRKITIPEIDLSNIGLNVQNFLPPEILDDLQKAEKLLIILRLYYNQIDYGVLFFKLYRSLENLIKLLIHEFISTEDVEDSIHFLTQDTRLGTNIPIIKIIKYGVKGYTLGFILKVIREICSYPEEFEIRKKLHNYLRNHFPLNISIINKLLELKNIRNIYTHRSGESITPEQFFEYRDFCYQVMNLLRANISHVDLYSKISTKKEALKMNL